MGLDLLAQASVLLLERAPRLPQREVHTDPRHQLFGPERLREVVDGAGGERVHLVRHAVERGQEDDRQVARRLFGFHAFAPRIRPCPA
jgi:hypothetical protein